VSGLLERDAELAVLAERYRQVAAGRGGVVLLCGEAGLGKTSLVEHFAAVLRRGSPRPAWFLVGLCEDLLTPSPLGAIHDMAQWAPEHARTALLAAGNAATAAVVLAELARTSPGPVVLVVEDVHWADEATLDVLRVLSRRIGTVPALLVASYRDDELDGRTRCASGSESCCGTTPRAGCGSRRCRRRRWPPWRLRTASTPTSCTGGPPATRSSSRRRWPPAPSSSPPRSATPCSRASPR
jgi:hypothetical protein